MLRIGIRGAGVAGLSLARALLAVAPDLRLTLFDRRPRTPHPQRTLCSFEHPGTPLPVEPACRWPRVRFTGAGLSRAIACPDTPYTLVRGDDFFETTLRLLESHGVEQRWSCARVEVTPQTITTERGVESFDLVVDAAWSPEVGSARLWQSFLGIRIETETPAFDPTEAILMDLLPSTPASPVCFVYILPFSASSALIEHTTLSVTPQPADLHLAGCTAWLAARGISSWRETSREQGIIPMGTTRPVPPPTVATIGTAGGWIRPATGYGFQTTLEMTARMARECAEGRTTIPPQSPFPWWLRAGDALFLRALRAGPLHGRTLLEGMLRRGRDRDILAFLSGGATLGQALRVMSVVPKAAMIQALCGVQSRS